MPANPDEKVYITSHYPGLNWEQDETGTWKTAYVGVYSVFDLRHKDEYGVPIPLENKISLAECHSEKGTWYFDNDYVYIHTWDEQPPNDANYAINVSSAHFEPTLINNAELYVENCIILHGRSTDSMVITASTTGGVSGTFIANNSVFAGGDLRINRNNEINAISFKNVKNIFLFSCIAAYGGEDGFNYHYSSVSSEDRRKCLVVEYNCTSYRHGKFSTTRTANCSTAHDGICVLRVYGLYFESTGPVVNDANGCLSVYYDCTAQDGLANNQIQRSAFRADNDGATTKGKLVLVNCNGGGKDTYSVYSGDDMEIVLQAFRGTYIPDGLNITDVI